MPTTSLRFGSQETYSTLATLIISFPRKSRGGLIFLRPFTAHCSAHTRNDGGIKPVNGAHGGSHNFTIFGFISGLYIWNLAYQNFLFFFFDQMLYTHLQDSSYECEPVRFGTLTALLTLEQVLFPSVTRSCLCYRGFTIAIKCWWPVSIARVPINMTILSK